MTLSAMLTYLMMGFNAPFGIMWACQYVLALTSNALAVMVGSAVVDAATAVEVSPPCSAGNCLSQLPRLTTALSSRYSFYL